MPRGGTPAIVTAERAKISFAVHEYTHREDADSFGLEAAAALGVDPRRVYKTLVVAGEGGNLAVGIVPVDARLNLRAFAVAIGSKRVELARPVDAERATGYVIGGISPLGQRKRLPTVLDDTALAFATIYVSGGRRGLEIELSPSDLIALTRAKTAAICH